MGLIADRFAQAFRQFVTDGVPASGRNWPDKLEVQLIGRTIEGVISTFASGLTPYASKAALDAAGNPGDGSLLAFVYNNNGSASDPANGVYQWNGTAWVVASWYFAAVAGVVQPLVDAAAVSADQAEAALAELQVGFSAKERWYLVRKQVVTAAADVNYAVERAVLLDGSQRDYAPLENVIAAGLSTGGFVVGSGAESYYLVRKLVVTATADPVLRAMEATLVDGSVYPATPAASAAALGPIVCIGDSLTAGAGGTPYPSQLASLSGREVINFGIGGQQGFQIAGRMGAIGVPMSAASNRLVAGANAIIAINGVAPQSVYAASPSNFQNTNLQILSAPDSTTRTIRGVWGSVRGTKTRTASGGTYTSATTETYTFTPDADAVLPANLPAGTMFVADYAYEAATHIFWPFRNNYTLGAGVNMPVLRAMTERLSHKRFLVMPIINGGFASEYAGGSGYQFFREMEDAEANTYPGKYVPIRRLLIDAFLSTAGLSPTSQDTTDIGNDTVPTQARSDGIHGTTASYGFIAFIANTALVAKGY